MASTKKVIKTIAKIILALVGILVLLVGGFGWYFSAPSYDGPVSAHFDGRTFFNEVPRERSMWRFLTWITTRKPGTWSTEHKNGVFAKPMERVASEAIRVTFVNHATTLIQVASLNILTDPIWSERCSPLSFAGPKRVRPPGILIEDLPKIDVILISHNHYDHLDLPTLKQLRNRDNPHIIAGLGNKALLLEHGFTRVSDFDWWDHERFNDVAIWGVPAQHFSGRGLWDRNRTLWLGFVITGPQGKIYFAGDTGFGPHFKQIRDRFLDITVAILPIGAFMPREIMSHVHLSPTEALAAAEVLHAQESIGIHFGTFRLADDAEEAPKNELTKAKPQFARGQYFHVLGFGEARDFTRTTLGR